MASGKHLRARQPAPALSWGVVYVECKWYHQR